MRGRRWRRHVGDEAKLGFRCAGVREVVNEGGQQACPRDRVCPPPGGQKLRQLSVPPIGSMFSWWRSSSGPSLRFSRSRVMTPPSRLVKYTVSAAPSNAEEPRSVLPSLPAWWTPSDDAAPGGGAGEQPDHGVDDDAAVLRRVLVGADHAAGQGVEDDEAVAAPVDERGQVGHVEPGW